MIEIRSVRGWLRISKALRRGISVRIKSWEIGSSAPWPEASERDLMTIRLACHVVGQSRNATWVEWSGTPGKAGHCEIEAAPKEMNGADLPDIGGAKPIEHSVDRDDRL